MGAGAIGLAGAKNDSIEVHSVYPAPTDGLKATPPQDHTNSFLMIETDDEAMAARVIKALQHAVALCRAASKPDLLK
jgi:hypothetical protein